MDYYVQNGFKTIFSRQVEAGNPGNIAMGYVLDLMDIVKPAVATFDQRTAVVIRSFREGGISPLLIGAMVDDAFHKRGTARLPFDFFMDKKRLNSSLLPIWVLLCLRKEYFLLKATQSR